VPAISLRQLISARTQPGARFSRRFVVVVSFLLCTSGAARTAVMAGRTVDGEASLRRTVQRGQSMILQNALVTEMDSFDMTMIVPQDHRAQDYPVFHMEIFLEQVVYQVLFPLSLILVYVVRGHDAAANMRFIPTKDQTYVAMFQYVLNGALVVMVTLLFFCGYSWADLSMQMDVVAFFLLGEVALAVVTSVFQRLAVATKWSYLPKEQYDVVMTQRVTFEALQGDQIVNAWLSLASNTYGVMDKELHLAQKRLGIDARRVHLRIASDKLEWLEKEVCRVEDVGGIIEDDEESAPRSLSPRVRSVRFAVAPPQRAPGDDSGRGLDAQPTRLPVYAAASSSGQDAKAAVDGPVHAPRPPGLRFVAEAERVADGTSSPSSGGRRKAPRKSVNVFSDPRLHASQSEEGEGHEDASGPLETTGPVGGWKRISSFTLTKMLIYKSSKSAQLASTNVGWATFLMCLFGSCLPILVRGACGLPVLGRNVPQGAIFLLSIYCGFMYPYIYATYLRVAYLDFRRRADVLKRLGELAMLSNPRQIRKAAGGRASAVSSATSSDASNSSASAATATPRTESLFDVELMRSRAREADGTAGGGVVSRDEMAVNPLAAAARARNRGGLRTAASESSGRDKLPAALSPAPLGSALAGPGEGGKRKKTRSGGAVIPLDHVGNVVGFYITRRMLRVFGLRYFMRLQAYTSQALVLTALIIVAMIVLTVTGATQLISFASIGFAAVALFYLVLLSGFILAMLLYGAMANEQNAEHCGILAARRLEAKQAAAALRRAGYGDEAAESNDVAQVIRGVAHMIETEDKLEPLRILGVPASYTVLQAIGVSLLSAVASGVNLLRGVLFK